MLVAVSRNLRVLGALLILVIAFGASIGIALSLTSVVANNNVPGELHACYSRYTGEMRFVYDPANCTASEGVLSWNQQGIQGPPGPGTTMYINDEFGFVDGAGFIVQTWCNDNNDLVISGGYQIPSPHSPADVDIQQSYPLESQFGVDNWVLRGDESNAAGSVGILSYVVCQDIPG